MVCSVVTVCIMSWLSSSPNQNSGHAVVDSNLNTSQCSLFLFILSVAVDRRRALFSYELQSRGASAWKKLMVICTSHHLTSLAAMRCCVRIFRCSIRLYTFFHYASLTSVTKSERLLALEIFLSYDMCIWRKLFQFKFFCCWKNAILAFFCTYWGLLQFCLLYYLSSFF